MQKKGRKAVFGIAIFVFFLCFASPVDVSAFSSVNYQSKSLCGAYEVAGFHADGAIIPVSCQNSFESAKAFMQQNGADDLAILTNINGKVEIVDANVALLDLTIPPDLTYFYQNSNLTGSSYTYMDTGSLYGGVDGALIDTSYASSKGTFTAKVKLGNMTGWIEKKMYEIVPITWVKSSSSYTVTNDSIRHHYVAKIQDAYNGSYGSTIGPKPSMLSHGTYYSYDGHYFYTNLTTLIKDYKNGTYQNAVNKNEPYYNYYMYLSNHTKTSYSSINIDEYIRSSLGATGDVYGNRSQGGTSRLYGKGTFFYYAQEKYGVNALLSLSLSRNETGNGRSNLAVNKNNGFGLNAVDTSPTETANWYASFASSILGYASKWITYGYAHPRDWRYFGPQFGDKWIGMNVKYASDTFWSEKMAANYYAFDKAKGLQDYNFYQLGVVTGPTNAMSDASNSSRFIYSYPEAEDAVVIVGEKYGEVVGGSNVWYQVVSDLNIDGNYNEITAGDYNWNGTVYIPASHVKKINEGKNGYISPNEITEYQDKNYEYDLYVENTVLQPKVAVTTETTDYYYDASLLSKKGQILLKDRYVMVYSAAYDEHGTPVSYLVTSDYFNDQKEWVKASSLRFVTSSYGHVEVSVSGNQYTWVNSIPEETASTVIGGQYTNSYVPILEEKTVDGRVWYKVPVDVSGDRQAYGWTLQSSPGVLVTLYTAVSTNQAPVIKAEDKTVIQGSSWNALDEVTATDQEDGVLTKHVEIASSNVDIHRPGVYEITYKVTDSGNLTTTKTIRVTVIQNEKPVITAKDVEIKQGKAFDPLDGVTASDKEDGDLTKKVTVLSGEFDTQTPGVYEITYRVVDSYNQVSELTITLTVLKDEAPSIEADDLTLTVNQSFDPLEGVTANDKEDGVIKDKVKVVKNNVNIKKVGTYEITYAVTDSYGNKTTKTIQVTVVEDQMPVIEVENQTIYLNETFEPLSIVKAKDKEDGDLTKKVTVVKENVDTSKIGTYEVTYQVIDSYGNKEEKTIEVKVVEKQKKEEKGLFYFDYLKKTKDGLEIKGYHAISGLDHTKDVPLTYSLVFENIQTNEEIKQKITRIMDKEEMTRPVYSSDGKDYTYSWFKGVLDIDSIKDGDYRIFILTEGEDVYAKTLVSNKVLKEQIATYTSEKTVTTRNNYRDSNAALELLIRTEKIASKTADSVYNQYNQYRTFAFEDNKLHIKGTSYSLGMDLALTAKVERQIIFENTTTFKKYTYDLDSITDGLYQVGATLEDGYDKTRAWFDKKIDISNIPKGNYAIYLATKSNISDFGELTELLLRSLDDVVLEKNHRTYSFKVREDLRYRVELNVE